MTARRSRCPVCGLPKTLRSTDENAWPHCIRGCGRDAIIAALRAERAPDPAGPLAAWQARHDEQTSTPLHDQTVTRRRRPSAPLTPPGRDGRPPRETQSRGEGRPGGGGTHTPRPKEHHA